MTWLEKATIAALKREDKASDAEGRPAAGPDPESGDGGGGTLWARMQAQNELYMVVQARRDSVKDSVLAISQVARAAGDASDWDGHPDDAAEAASRARRALDALRQGEFRDARLLALDAEVFQPRAYLEFAARVDRLADYMQRRRERRRNPETD